ncbi:FixH family protein [Marinobacter salinexigens]|uniref:FixH family protein n=1 Tax=Marinobacter salinexigens TaxID=2919747 RepID=A0A5B0VJN7_9GAMM|nr:FixH family protein [Marinobacter salinexigens]KAA1174937.1 FixH family protein [Marinobacter salinexigens]
MTDQAPVAPWYRQPWFWFLTIFPLAAIIWCIFMIIVAINTRDPMVTDDYSKEGRSINMDIARDERATALGMVAELDFEGRDLYMSLESNEGVADFPYLVLNLYHPTLSENDRTIQFQATGNGHYSGKMLEDIDGRWYYDLRGPSNEWRLKGEAWLPAENGLKIQAKDASQG